MSLCFIQNVFEEIKRTIGADAVVYQVIEIVKGVRDLNRINPKILNNLECLLFFEVFI